MKLKRREPNQKEVIRGILKFAAGTSALLTGAFVLSRLAIFKGKDFLTPNLTATQINAMDEHNKNHELAERVDGFGTGLLAGAGVVISKADRKKIDKEIENERTNFFNNDVKDLPGTLAHTH